MPEVSIDLTTKATDLASVFPWVNLYEIAVDDTTYLRLAAYSENVTWDNQTWSAFGITHAPVKEDGDGSLASVSVTFADPLRIISSLLEKGDNIIGRNTRIITVNTAHITGQNFLSSAGIEYEATDQTPTTYGFDEVVYDTAQSISTGVFPGDTVTMQAELKVDATAQTAGAHAEVFVEAKNGATVIETVQLITSASSSDELNYQLLSSAPYVIPAAATYVRIYSVHTDTLAGASFAKNLKLEKGSVVTPYTTPGLLHLEQSFEVVGAVVKQEGTALTLGFGSLMHTEFPTSVYHRDTCRWLYKSGECGYTGSLPTCDKTLGDLNGNGCAAHTNEVRFGAFPGIPSNGIRFSID